PRRVLRQHMLADEQIDGATHRRHVHACGPRDLLLRWEMVARLQTPSVDRLSDRSGEAPVERAVAPRGERKLTHATKLPRSGMCRPHCSRTEAGSHYATHRPAD